jgi:hypothetical protein
MIKRSVLIVLTVLALVTTSVLANIGSGAHVYAAENCNGLPGPCAPVPPSPPVTDPGCVINLADSHNGVPPWCAVAVPVPPPIHPGGLSTQAVAAANAYVDRHYPAVQYQGTTYCGNTCTNPNQFKSFTSTVYPVQVPETYGGVATGYFYAAEFGFNSSTAVGYGGLQNHLITGGVDTGHGVIFSIFGGTGCGAVLGTCETFTEPPGSGYSIHWTTNWLVGHTYKLFFENIVYDPAGPNGFVGQVKFTVIDVSTGQSYWLGYINYPNGSGFNGQRNETQWTEKYLPTSIASCSDQPVSKVLWTGATYMTSYYPPAATYPNYNLGYIQNGTGCTNSASINAGGSPPTFWGIVGATS